jgi:hypothetical protein
MRFFRSRVVFVAAAGLMAEGRPPVQMRRFLATAIVVAVALVAPSEMATAASSTATSTTTAKVKGAGISLAYPETWIVVPLTKKGLASVTKAVAKNNPKLAALISGADLSQFKLYAVDAIGAGGVYDNVSVSTTTGVDGFTVAQLREGLNGVYKPAGATVVDVKAVKLGGTRAFRSDVTYPFKSADGATTPESIGQLLIPRSASTTIVTVTSSEDAAGAGLINSILGSVHKL